MTSPPTPAPPPRLSLCKLISVLILTAGMLLASTMTLKASWLWVLAPVGLLMLWEERMGQGAGERREVRGEKWDFSGWVFYAGVLGVAVAFHFFGLSAGSGGRNLLAFGGCGSGGCGTAGGCGHGGCGAASGQGCSCGSGKTSSSATAATKFAKPAMLPKPVTATPPNRNLNVQLPPLPARTPGSSVPTAPAVKPPAVPTAPGAVGANRPPASAPGSVQPPAPNPP